MTIQFDGVPKFKKGDIIQGIEDDLQDKIIVDITGSDYIVDVLDNEGVPIGDTDFPIDYIDAYYKLKDDDFITGEHIPLLQKALETVKDEHSEEKQAEYTYSIYRTDIDEFDEFEYIVSEVMSDDWLELTDSDGDTYRIRAEVITSIRKAKGSE